MGIFWWLGVAKESGQLVHKQQHVLPAVRTARATGGNAEAAMWNFGFQKLNKTIEGYVSVSKLGATE